MMMMMMILKPECLNSPTMICEQQQEAKNKKKRKEFVTLEGRLRVDLILEWLLLFEICDYNAYSFPT